MIASLVVDILKSELTGYQILYEWFYRTVCHTTIRIRLVIEVGKGQTPMHAQKLRHTADLGFRHGQSNLFDDGVAGCCHAFAIIIRYTIFSYLQPTYY